jgi:hypothetical protein
MPSVTIRIQTGRVTVTIEADGDKTVVVIVPK